jgi:hypothetical protein
MKNENYLKTFFKEKEIPFKQWELQDENNNFHIINNEVVIEFILKDKGNHKIYADTLRKIDFRNGDVNHYLLYIAKGMVNL